MERKALSGSLLPLVVSASLLAGVASLSLADPGGEVRSPRPSSGDLPGNTSLPGTPGSELNASGGRSLPNGLNSSGLEPSGTGRRSGGSGSGLTSGVAEEIFKAIAGSAGRSQNLSSTGGGANGLNTSSGSRPADNGTVSQGGSSTRNRSDGGGTGDTRNTSARPGNSSATENAAQDRGTLSNLTEALTGLLQGSDTNKSSAERDGGSGSQKDPGSSQTNENESQSAGSGLVPDIPAWLGPVLALVVAAGALVAGWRSNVDMEALLRSLAGRTAGFVRSLPDLLRRLTVEVVSRAVSLLERSMHAVVSALRAPVRTLSEALEKMEERSISGLRAARGFEIGQISRALRGLLPYEKQPGSGLGSVWYILKRKAGLTGGSTLTPAEIGRRAKERGAEPGTVDEVVDVYRKRTYYPEVFDVELKIQKWKAELGDADEDT